MSEVPNNQPFEDKLSLNNAIDFLADSWKLILGVGVIGLLSASVFLWVTPSQYEAVVQIKLAQINVKNDTNFFGKDLEDVNNVVARFRLPSAYSVEEMKACNLANGQVPNDSIVSLVKMSVIKSSTSTIQLNIRMNSKEHLVGCTQAIYERIRESQAEILAPFIEKSRALLLVYQARLREIRGLINRADNSDHALTAAYLTGRDELIFLSNEIIRLNNIINSSFLLQTKMVNPVYISDVPVFPKKNHSLLIGLLAGVFLGVLFVFVSQARDNHKSKP